MQFICNLFINNTFMFISNVYKIKNKRASVCKYMYADDLVVFSLSSAGFQQLLNICSDYGIRYDVQYNTKKECGHDI